MKPGEQHGMQFFLRPLLLVSGVAVGVVSSASEVPRRNGVRGRGLLRADIDSYSSDELDHGRHLAPAFAALQRTTYREDPADDVEYHIEDESKDIARDSLRTISRIGKAPERLPAEMNKQFEFLKETFLPGFEPKTKVYQVVAILVCLNLTWFIVYFMYMYVPDFNEVHHVKTEQETKDIIAEQQGKMLFGLLANSRFLPEVMRPDMIMIFHNPGAEVEEHEKNEMIPKEGFRHVFATRLENGKMMDQSHTAEVLEGEPGKDVSKAKAREALLQDFYASLPKMGFDSEIFRSTSNKQLFVCISLSQEDWIENYFMRYKVELQVQDKVVDALDIGECADPRAASPPFIRYDPLTVQQLFERNKVERPDPACLYKRNIRGHIANTQERFRIIHRQVNCNINLSRGLKDGFLVDWYPVHNLLRLQQLGAMWSSLSHLKDLTYKQPLTLLQGYFGSQVAISLAWRGFYCKALLALVPAAVIWQILSWFTWLLPDMHDYLFRQIIAWAIVIILWAKIVANMWDREEDYFLNRWNVHSHAENTVRSAFQGKMETSPVDANMKEVQVSPFEYWTKCTLSSVITVILCIVMATWIFLWVSLFEGKLTNVSTIMLVVQIKVFEFSFNWISIQLTKWENHKYREDYYNNLLWKVFSFQMVNQYWTFIYLAVQQRRTEWGCPEGGCLLEIRNQLTMALFVLAIASVVQVATRSLLVRLQLWWEDQPKEAGFFARLISMFSAEAREAQRHSFVEEQAKYGSWDIEDQVMSMVQATICVGYVILFGAVAPAVIPLSFVVMTIELRGTAFYLTTHARRPVPAMALGKSACQKVVSFLMHVGLFWSGILLGEFGYLLRDEAIIAKVTFAFMFTLLMAFLWVLVDLVYPSTSALAQLMFRRRKRVLDFIAAETAEAVEQKAKQAAGAADDVRASRMDSKFLNTTGEGDDDSLVQNGDWDGIQTFSEMLTEKTEKELEQQTALEELEKATRSMPMRTKSVRKLGRQAFGLGSGRASLASMTQSGSPPTSARPTPRPAEKAEA